MTPSIVDVNWLHENQTKVKIVCVSTGMGTKPDWQEYKEKYYGKFEELIAQRASTIPGNLIPNSVYFDVEIAFFPGQFQRLSLYPAELFQEYIRLLGINEGDHVVFYGNGPAAGMLFAARAWWALKAYGLSTVSVLNGGFDSWRNAGFPIDSHIASVSKGNFHAKPVDSSLLITYEELDAKDSEGKALFDKLDTINYLDARPKEQFTGEAPLGFPAPEATGAHIRGSKSVPLVAVMTPTGIKSKADIENALNAAGFNLDKPIVTSCMTGVQAALLSLALTNSDYPFRLFNGSIIEVGARGSHYINEK